MFYIYIYTSEFLSCLPISQMLFDTCALQTLFSFYLIQTYVGSIIYIHDNIMLCTYPLLTSLFQGTFSGDTQNNLNPSFVHQSRICLPCCIWKVSFFVSISWRKPGLKCKIDVIHITCIKFFPSQTQLWNFGTYMYIFLW